MAHTCVYHGDPPECAICGAAHRCGPGVCDSLFFNPDYTSVCRVTGRCFAQMQCGLYEDPHQHGEPEFHRRAKRDQQFKNRRLERTYVVDMVRAAAPIVALPPGQVDALVPQVLKLWQLYVNRDRALDMYTRRHVRRCFVVSVVMALRAGLCSDGGVYIVRPHPDMTFSGLNKKRDYGMFRVTDICVGENLIKNRFRGEQFDARFTVSLPETVAGAAGAPEEMRDAGKKTAAAAARPPAARVAEPYHTHRTPVYGRAEESPGAP